MVSEDEVQGYHEAGLVLTKSMERERARRQLPARDEERKAKSAETAGIWRGRPVGLDGRR